MVMSASPYEERIEKRKRMAVDSRSVLIHREDNKRCSRKGWQAATRRLRGTCYKRKKSLKFERATGKS